MIKLPEKFCNSMKELLRDEYDDYLESFEKKVYSGFRVNTKKISLDKWKEINPFTVKNIAWIEKGFYYDPEIDLISKHPYYFAGLYYIQEPSAMIPASLLPVEEGDKVLDLCAAPGGKATELGAKLNGTGLIVANDISVSRTMALAKNLKLAGIHNSVVTAEKPEKLAEVFNGYFDKILVDAPCSGEGMFRKEHSMIKDWLEKGPEYYQNIQKDILRSAYKMLKPGGMMVYSTCTFSYMEDEQIIQWLLDEYSDMQVCPVERKEGFCAGRPDMLENADEQLKNCVRIFPHRADGEGHFAALLRKDTNLCDNEIKSENQDDLEFKKQNKVRKKDKRKDNHSQRKSVKSQQVPDEAKDICTKIGIEPDELVVIKDSVVWQPGLPFDGRGVRITSRGVNICEVKNKLQYSQQLALLLNAEDYKNVLDFNASDEIVIRYLKGETIQTEKNLKGNVLVCVDGYGLGWCQGNGNGMYKNKYYPAWRYQ